MDRIELEIIKQQIKEEIEEEIINELHFGINYSFRQGLTTVKKLQLKYKDKILSEKRIK